MRRTNRSSHWVTVKEGSSDHLFLLRGETGDAVIDPRACSYNLQGKNSRSWRVRANKELKNMLGFAHWFDFRPFKRYRLSETLIQVDEPLLVLGFFRTVDLANPMRWRGLIKPDNHELVRWQNYTQALKDSGSKKELISFISHKLKGGYLC